VNGYRPANAFPKGNTIGHATRFKPGHRLSVGYGRPRTSILNRKLKKELYYNPALNLDAQVQEWLAFALAGSELHAALIEKHIGPELWREIKLIAEKCKETGVLFQWRRPKKSYSTRKMGGNKARLSHFATKQDDFLQESAPATPNPPVFNAPRSIAEQKWAEEASKIDGFRPENSDFRGVSVHDVARKLVGVTDQPKTPAPGKRRVRIELW
jgi:hypothetical protein